MLTLTNIKYLLTAFYSLPNRQAVRTIQSLKGEKGWVSRDGAFQCDPGSILACCYTLLEFVGSCFAPRLFLWVKARVYTEKIQETFPPSTKINISNFQFNQDRGLAHETPAQVGVAFS